jgi:glycosyltransferase involved in cell wall biosynthesis
MTGPLVSCLMPTADRRRCVPLAVETFLRQDYAARELVVLDDGVDPISDELPSDPRIRYVRTARWPTLGEKRNETCRLARGEIFVHWDDDDWSAPWRLSYQVRELQTHAADICGLDRLWFYDPQRDLAWLYEYRGGRAPWVAGSTLCYRRRVWERQPFPDLTEGEDTLWIESAVGARVLPLERRDFFIARVHQANTSPKDTDGAWWAPRNSAAVRALLGSDLREFGAPPAPPAPLASCILATGQRRSFFEIALERYLAQDHPNKELVVIDEGSEGVADLVRDVPNLQYLHIRGHQSVAVKRNLGCMAAKGEILVQWDDDDWYGSARLSRQVAPLADGRADVTALETRWIADLATGDFWTLSPDLHRRMFYCDVTGGTLAFTRAVWAAGARYSDDAGPEDAAFLYAALCQGHRLLRVANDGLFVYLRHHRNTWSFVAGRHLDASGWGRTAAPVTLSVALLERYQAAARDLT